MVTRTSASSSLVTGVNDIILLVSSTEIVGTTATLEEADDMAITSGSSVIERSLSKTRQGLSSTSITSSSSSEVSEEETEGTGDGDLAGDDGAGDDGVEDVRDGDGGLMTKSLGRGPGLLFGLPEASLSLDLLFGNPLLGFIGDPPEPTKSMSVSSTIATPFLSILKGLPNICCRTAVGSNSLKGVGILFRYSW